MTTAMGNAYNIKRNDLFNVQHHRTGAAVTNWTLSQQKKCGIAEGFMAGGGRKLVEFYITWLN